jgi:hypothetical protein
MFIEDLLTVLVPFNLELAVPACLLKAHVEPADTGKQTSES